MVALPLASVTVQVTVVVPKLKVAGALLVTEATEQLSAVTGVPNTTPVAVQAVLVVVLIAAGAVMVGKVLSIIVTVCVAVAVLPLASVTVQVTVVVPVLKVAGALCVTEATEQLSAATGVPRFKPVTEQVALALAVILAGATIVGLVASTTVTVCVAVAVRPLPSVTVQVTVVVPIAKVAGALCVTEATEQLSEVTGVPRATFNAIQLLFVVVLTAAGAVMVGLTLSITVTSWFALVALPLASVTVQVTVVVPRLKADGALLVTEATEQSSAVTGVPNTTPVAVQAVLVVVFIAAGAVIVGLTLSCTITV